MFSSQWKDWMLGLKKVFQGKVYKSLQQINHGLIFLRQRIFVDFIYFMSSHHKSSYQDIQPEQTTV